MIAILKIVLPFELMLPNGQNYNLYTHQEDKYAFTHLVPISSGLKSNSSNPEHMLLNGSQAFLADTLVIKISGENFDRRLNCDIDPPKEIINKVINSFLSRMRFVAKAPQIKEVSLDNSEWVIEYLNDDGSELEKLEGLLRGRFSKRFSFSHIACDPSMWDKINTLPAGFEPPVWITLIIDAHGAMPHVGTSLVLAATALEVFIFNALEGMQLKSPISNELWSWINDRGNYQKEPSVEEQYSVLLKELCGHSLQEEPILWEAFKNLKSARNSFVHEGVAKIGKSKVTVSQQDASALIQRASEILEKVREWLPSEMQWPIFSHTVDLEIGKIILANPAVENDEKSA